MSDGRWKMDFMILAAGGSLKNEEKKQQVVIEPNTFVITRVLRPLFHPCSLGYSDKRWKNTRVRTQAQAA